MSTPLEPIDPLHRQCMDARAWIKDRFAVLQALALLWEPKPCPPKEECP
jgi:hypothetical protein